jgi:NitT/TauT family transport system substrate-binding protein
MSIRRWMVAALLGSVLAAAAARAEPAELRIARGYPISYLPLMVMEHDQLVQKHLAAAGLSGVKVAYSTFAGPNGTTEALLSGNAEFVAGGIPALITLWAKTKDRLAVRAIATLSEMPLFLMTRNPEVRTIADFTERDKISLPTVKLSTQAIILEMAAEQRWGIGHHGRLDELTVSLGHPDALVAMLSGSNQIDSDFTAPPYQYVELRDPRFHRVLTSYEVLGGSHSFNAIWTTGKFHDANPRAAAAVLAAVREAMDLIAQDRGRAATIFLELSRSKETSDALLKQILDDPETRFTTTPNNVMKFADFMYRTGSIKVKPASWKDLFFPEAQDQPGS